MNAQSYEIPKIPPINEVKPLGGVKQCPVCRSDNKATAALCVNCKSPFPKGTRTFNQNQRDPEGEQSNNQKESVFMNSPVTKMHVPGFPVNAQIISNPKMIKDRVKPIKPKRMISDDDVNVVDDNHLNNVQQSADTLGL